ncbi:uncharacterized protein RHO25_009047 [Cercospora beticola]|uniref:FAS1 domain-containing protein n=1 Tax=Cercospora beticola TaxID=122368 RepID=A0ABZ0NY33_CERBT|nr:hypothetical protein RHO25_009047 [Cercospora beticola]CAK1356771.1 unnamed protein product [Cercospora beticola]
MLFSTPTISLLLTTLFTPTLLASPISAPEAVAAAAAAPCTSARKIEGIKQELRTIISHSFADAAKIPLAPLASRTFIVLPTELQTFFAVPLPVNVGFTADTVRAELVALGTILDADVPGGPDNGATFTVNQNGTVTVDFVQTDRIALPRVDVREIHSFNEQCEITKILGYVRGPLV